MKIPILLPNIFNHPFTYESDINLKVGDYVVVPFGKYKITGVVWDEFEKHYSRELLIMDCLDWIKDRPYDAKEILDHLEFCSNSEKTAVKFPQKDQIL